MRRYEYSLLHSLSKWVLQQRYAAARSTVPSRKSATEATTQLLSPVLGSAAVVAVAALGLAVLATLVLVTVVAVLVGAAAGFSEGFAVGPVVGSPAAGLASAGDLFALSSGISSLSVSPRRRRSALGFNHHVRCHRTGGIHYATSTKDPTGRRYKPRGHK